MDSKERLITTTKSLEIISNRLRELSNLIVTVHLGLMEENTEKQVLDCIICFLYAVNELHDFTEQAVRTIHAKEDNSN